MLLLLALVVTAGLLEVFGVRSRSVSAASADQQVSLELHYAHVARAGLSVPFEVTVHRQGGFDQKIVLAVSNDYLGIFDQNAKSPEPVEETGSDREIEWRFDPPEGETFTFSLDARVQGSRHWGRSGLVRLLDEAGSQLAQVKFKTWLAP
jgi:hypothetical protein